MTAQFQLEVHAFTPNRWNKQLYHLEYSSLYESKENARGDSIASKIWATHSTYCWENSSWTKCCYHAAIHDYEIKTNTIAACYKQHYTESSLISCWNDLTLVKDLHS